MNYEKPALSLDEQVDKLFSRGMLGDRELMKSRLATVSYYRLSGYWYTLRKRADMTSPPEDDFIPGTTFDVVWERYTFDRALRLLILDGVERIEVAIRTLVSYHHAHAHTAFAYAEDRSSLPKFKPHEWDEFHAHVREDIEKSKEEFVSHFRAKYGAHHPNLPIWMASEVMTFGCVIKMLSMAPNKVKTLVANAFGQPYETLETWFLTLNTIRNLCAHHCRLWNREVGINPRVPPGWAALLPATLAVNGKRNPALRRIFTSLTLCNYCLGKVSPGSGWASRLKRLLDDYPGIPRLSMGFPPGWLKSVLWANADDSPGNTMPIPVSVLPPLLPPTK